MTKPLNKCGWSSSAIWGRVYKESHDNTIEAITLESTLRFLGRHALSVRFEDTDKDELFPHIHRTGQIPRCFATNPKIMCGPSRSRRRLFLGCRVRP